MLLTVSKGAENEGEISTCGWLRSSHLFCTGKMYSPALQTHLEGMTQKIPEANTRLIIFLLRTLNDNPPPCQTASDRSLGAAEMHVKQETNSVVLMERHLLCEGSPWYQLGLGSRCGSCPSPPWSRGLQGALVCWGTEVQKRQG